MLKRNMKLIIACLFFGAAGLMIAAPVTVHAFDMSRYSESEKVGFAFHYMAGFDPHYEDWITDSDKYKDAKPIDKVELLQHDKWRLMNGFANYMPDRNLIRVGVEGVVHTSSYYLERRKVAPLKDIEINLRELPENYFPFYIGGIWIALVIKDYDLLTKFILNNDEYEEFEKKLGLSRKVYELSKKVNVDFRLRPVAVDTNAPLTLDGLEMWLMMVEVAEMDIWRARGDERISVWRYQAPWYIADKHREFLSLYKD